MIIGLPQTIWEFFNKWFILVLLELLGGVILYYFLVLEFTSAVALLHVLLYFKNKIKNDILILIF